MNRVTLDELRRLAVTLERENMQWAAITIQRATEELRWHRLKSRQSRRAPTPDAGGGHG